MGRPNLTNLKKRAVVHKLNKGVQELIVDSLSAADRVNLFELYARSTMLLELKREAEWVALFAPNATFRFVSGQVEHNPARSYSGSAELLVLARQLIGGNRLFLGEEDSRGARGRHHLSNLSLYDDGPGRASGYAYLTVLSIGADAPTWLASGLYADRLTKCSAGCWRFASRTLTVDGVQLAAVCKQTTRPPAC
jgi:hypothetical protein